MAQHLTSPELEKEAKAALFEADATKRGAMYQDIQKNSWKPARSSSSISRRKSPAIART